MPRCEVGSNRIGLFSGQDSVRSPVAAASLRINLVASVDRLGLLRSILRGVEDKNGKQIFKTLQMCGNFVPLGNKQTITYTGYENGRVGMTGIVRCKNPECPLCGNSRRQENVRKTKKAIMATLLKGGRAFFGTATQHPTLDPNKGIGIVRDFQKKARKIVDKRNWTINKARLKDGLEKKSSFWFQSIVEATFSSKPIYKDEFQNPIAAAYYIHSHTHFIVGATEEFSHEIDSVISKIKECWRKCVSAAKGWTFLDGSCSVSKKKAFQVDEISDDKGVSAYLSKIENKGDQLGLEINSGANKHRTGKGYGLNALLDLMIEQPNNPVSIFHRENIKTWFRALFRRRRMLQTGVDEFAKVFDAMWREKAERIANKRGFRTCIKEVFEAALTREEKWGYITYEDIARPEAAARRGWDVFMNEDSLVVETITEEILSAVKVVWREEIGQTLYCKLRKIGEAGLIEFVLRKHHYDGELGDIYSKMKQLSERWVYEEFVSFVFMCWDRGALLRAPTLDRLQKCKVSINNKEE